MPTHELLRLIGPADGKPFAQKEKMMVYTLTGFGSSCGNAYSYLEFRTSNDIVTGWRIDALDKVHTVDPVTKILPSTLD